jgi:hypothetical protein
MTKLYTTAFLLILVQTFGQKKECFCEKDSLMAESISCDTTYFSNKSKIFWQFNCSTIWLTLENKEGKKITIDEVPIELSGYAYRLGYHLIKEYKNSLLFRSDCAATGPCSYTLVDKNNGKKIREFYQLICIDSDVQTENEHEYDFNFVVYLSDSSIVVEYIESKKRVKVAFKDKLTAAIPEQQFDKMNLKNNVLTMFYETDDGKKSFKINLRNKKNNH